MYNYYYDDLYTVLMLLSIVCALYTLWLLLFHSRLFGLWDRIFSPASKAGKETEPTTAIATHPTREAGEAAIPPKRKEDTEYADIFLKKLPAMPRKHTYISIAMYDDLSELLPVIARGVSIPNFLENLLKHHFDTHRDEINELYRDKTSKRY
jgi:hypothetical protein